MKPSMDGVARLGIGRAGTRYRTASLLQFRADHARAVDAVHSEIPERWAARHGLIELRSEAESRHDYLLHPERGRRLRAADVARLKKMNRKSAVDNKPSVLVFVGDGLSSAAVLANGAPLLRALNRLLAGPYRMLKPFLVRFARVRIEDHIGEILRPDIVCMLVGERPGLATAESLSAYVIYRPRLSSREPDRSLISNIHRGGLAVADAARDIAALIESALRYRATGVKLAAILDQREGCE